MKLYLCRWENGDSSEVQAENKMDIEIIEEGFLLTGAIDIRD